MSDSDFQQRVTDLARRANIKVADLEPHMATLSWIVGRNEQPLFIVPYGDVWEFSCPSFVAVDDCLDIPKQILAEALKDNASKKRGFWCIEEMGGQDVLEFMHNMPHRLLTPGEFREICEGIVAVVEEAEQAFRQAWGTR
jgi:hypothetical protein